MRKISRTRRSLAPLVWMGLVTAAAGPTPAQADPQAMASPGQDGPTGVPADWREAEDVARAYLSRRTLVRVEAFRHVPYLFRGVTMDAFYYVLVRDHAVVTDRGPLALEAQLRAMAALRATELDVADLLELVAALEGYPPVGGGIPPANVLGLAETTGPLAALRPRLSRTPDGMQLVVYYRELPGGTGQGGRTNPHQLALARWTLTVEADYRTSWQREAASLDLTSGVVSP